MLYVIATPIGNMEDITLRAIRTLNEVDLIASEDTRRTGKLLAAHGIRRPLTSYHEFNKEKKSASLVKKMQEGEQIALVTDAGTPAVSDPGFLLVRECRRMDIPVVPLPGPNAAMAALSCSGFPTDAFSFYGFLPKKQAKREQFFYELSERTETIVCYESGNRIMKTLRVISKILPEWQVCIARELTKRFEEFLYGSAGELLHQGIKEKGEFVMLLSPKGLASNRERINDEKR